MPKSTKVAWDLSELFAGTDDPAVDQSLDAILAQAQQFAKRYRGKINNEALDTQTLLSAIKGYEEIALGMAKIGSYAALLFSADTSKMERGAFMQHVQERETAISLELMFFELELMAVSPNIIDPIAQDAALKDYQHFIHASRLFREHRLPESEEKILEEKANTGSRAFERLFEEMVSSVEFKITVDGEEKTLTEPEILALLRDHRREVRKSAAATLTKGLRDNARLLTFIFNTVVFDKSIDDRLRKYDHPEQARNTANELDRDTVETVISTCVENYDLVARYYDMKRQILGYDELTHYDRYAPLFEAKKEYSFDEAKAEILSSFGRFSGTMADAAADFFDKRWIDAEPRKGKRGGAFCMYVTPDLHPYVLLSFLNRKDDVMTLAHELGHGVHAYISRCQSYLNFHSVLPVAELASTFGEMLVFETLAAKSSREDKLALYAEKIEDVFATIFRQAAMYRFEQKLHNARRTEGELNCDEIDQMWQETIQEMFGDSVVLGEEHSCWWMYVNHFISSPFYVYAYSFGELLVMALYSMYKRDGEAFVPKYLELLRAGGSCSPRDLLDRVGIDVTDPEFWRGGMKIVEQLIDDFEKLYLEWKSKNGKPRG